MVRVIGKSIKAKVVSAAEKAHKNVVYAEKLFTASTNPNNSRSHRVWAYHEAKRIQAAAFAVLGSNYQLAHYHGNGMSA